MDADVAAPFGSWASVRGYFTPATLFLFLNLVIGTIALTSRSRDQRRRQEHHPNHDYAHHQSAHYQEPLHQQPEYHYYQQPHDHLYATPPAAPAPLARTSSVLDRLRSIGLYRFRSGDFPPEYGAGTVTNHHDAFSPVAEEEATTKQQAQYARSRSEPAPAREEKSRGPPQPRVVKKPAGTTTEVVRKSQQAARAPATSRVVVEAVAEDARTEEVFIGSSLRHHQEPLSPKKAERQFQQEEEYVPPPISRTSSVLERLCSIGLYSFLAADQPAATAAPTPAPTDTNKKQAPAPAHYDRSRSEPVAREQGKKKQTPEAKMSKSSSATKKLAASAGPADDCVDARAEAFIHSFRKEQSQKQVPLHHEEDDHVVVPPPPAPLARTSSVLDRLRSFSLYLRSSDPVVVPEDPVNKSSSAAADEKNKQAQQQYSRSRSEPGKKKTAKQGMEAARMSKTSSEVSIAEEKVAAPAEECVDARADDFINKFRQQLQLQRLNSLLSYGGAKQ